MRPIHRAFVAPGDAYRGKPFWAWNGKLEEGELRRQVRIMKRMGLGGFFMHSRVGLATPYLSTEWFRLVNACADEARKLGMEAWLYDEDRWPSGAAGGLVTRDLRYRHKNLVMVRCEPRKARFRQKPLAMFSARLDGHKATQVQRLERGMRPGKLPEGSAVLAFFVVPDSPSPWFNNGTYLDTMSHAAVQRYIQVTHEAYRKHCGRHFKSVIPGIFTDEPHHGGLFGKMNVGRHEGLALPWTPELPRHFRRRYGYNLLDFLPHLFFVVDSEEASRVRWHYHDCITHLFVDAFARQIGQWCERNGLLFTGHVLEERTLRSQTNVVGAAMRFYEHMQAPGIDVLTEHWREYTTAKQCASVQHQMGRRWMLSELYGCTGWDFPFEGHKAVGDWQAALGVNLRCPHLAWYTMAGEAKRDYPASIHFQSPWWMHYWKVEDYFARLGVVMTRGEPVRRLLVIHPVESVWARATMNWRQDKVIDRLEAQFEQLLQWLLDEHIDFDYGDEEMLSRLGKVQRGRRFALRVGRATYDVVLVPPMETIRSTTLSLLEAFHRAGGTVVFCGEAPALVDATPGAGAVDLARRCTCVPFERRAVADAVGKARHVSIRDGAGEKDGIIYHLRAEGARRLLFMCNTDRQKDTGELTVSVKGKGQVQLWDAETGRRFAVQADAADGWVRFRTRMPASGSRLFVVEPLAEELAPEEVLRLVRSEGLESHAWTAELTDFNVLVLDMPQFRVRHGPWEGPLEILKADGAIRKVLGLPRRGGGMVQPWARPQSRKRSAPVQLRYTIGIDGMPTGPVFIAVENPSHFAIKLNGQPVDSDADCGWWVDPAIRLLPVPGSALVVGDNELLMDVRMDEDCNLEACFLLGQFAVRVDGARARVTGDAPSVGFGDWTGQGLPFYAGSVVFRTRIQPQLQSGERLFVEVPRFAGACVRILIDGQQAGIIGWPPHEVEVTHLLGDKERVELAVEVVAHRRNAFGPLHHTQARPHWVGPGQFVSSGEQWQDAYNLVPAGCLEPPRLSVRVAHTGG